MATPARQILVCQSFRVAGDKKGICHKQTEGFLQYIEEEVLDRGPQSGSLDELGWPEREGLPMYNYNDAFAGLPRPNVQVMSSRGCPFDCTFCLWPQTIYGRFRVRRRSPEDIVAEIKFLLRRYGFKAVYFDDDVFNADREHVRDICRLIKQENIGVPWAAMAHAGLMDKELISLCAGSGMFAVKYGIESANRDILKNCRKNLDIDKAEEVIRETKKAGIKVHLTFCLGLPGETKQTLRQTAEFIKRIAPDSFQCSRATPLPGTEYFELCRAYGKLPSEAWADYDGNKGFIFDGTEMPVDSIERLSDVFSFGFNS